MSDNEKGNVIAINRTEYDIWGGEIVWYLYFFIVFVFFAIIFFRDKKDLIYWWFYEYLSRVEYNDWVFMYDRKNNFILAKRVGVDAWEFPLPGSVFIVERINTKKAIRKIRNCPIEQFSSVYLKHHMSKTPLYPDWRN